MSTSIRKQRYQNQLERQRLAQLKCEVKKIEEASKAITDIHYSKKDNFEYLVKEILKKNWG